MTAWSTTNKHSSITLSNANLTATKGGSNTDCMVIADTGYSSGKRVFSVVMNVKSDASPALARGTSPTNAYPGDNATSLGVIGGDGIYYNGGLTTPAPTIVSGNTVFMAVDFTNSRFWWRVGTGGQWNGSGTANPDTNTGGFNMSGLFSGNVLYPAAGFFSSGGQTTLDPTASGHGLSTFTPWDTSAAAYTLVADAGSFAITGQNASLKATRSLSAAAGSIAITGQPTALRATRSLKADAGSVAITGFPATLTKTTVTTNYVLTANAGSFSIAGQSARLAATRKLVASQGSVLITGRPANLVYTPKTTAYVLTASAGSFAITGRSANLVYSGSTPVQPTAGGMGGGAQYSRRELERFIQRELKRWEKQKQAERDDEERMERAYRQMFPEEAAKVVAKAVGESTPAMIEAIAETIEARPDPAPVIAAMIKEMRRRRQEDEAIAFLLVA